jgi:hypothetical protein
MADVNPNRQSLIYPLFDPRSLLAQRIPLTLNANKNSVEQLTSYALKANQIRKEILQRALQAEVCQINIDGAKSTRVEKL